MKPQIFTSKEFAVFHAFADANFSDLKSMFEGKGAQLSTNKFVQFEKMFVGGLFIIATNKLPAISHPKNYKFHSEWLPFKSRFDMVVLQDNHDGTTPFPYTKEELACALLCLLRKQN